MTLRFKFVLPINLILVGILAASLGWEWWRLERSEFAILRTRLDEEARFVHRAARTFGVSSKFDDFLQEFAGLHKSPCSRRTRLSRNALASKMQKIRRNLA